MNLRNSLASLLGACIVLLVSAAVGNASISPRDGEADVSRPELVEPVYLAHHAGSRPDWATDIEDVVHGGEYDDTIDPNPTNPEPENQFDEEQGQGENNRQG